MEGIQNKAVASSLSLILAMGMTPAVALAAEGDADATQEPTTDLVVDVTTPAAGDDAPSAAAEPVIKLEDGTYKLDNFGGYSSMLKLDDGKQLVEPTLTVKDGSYTLDFAFGTQRYDKIFVGTFDQVTADTEGIAGEKLADDFEVEGQELPVTIEGMAFSLELTASQIAPALEEGGQLNIVVHRADGDWYEPSSQWYLSLGMTAEVEYPAPVEEPAATIEDGTYTLPGFKAAPGQMFNHIVDGTALLSVSGDTATLSFVTDGSTASIAKYSRIALGKTSELVETAYQPELPEGTKIIDGMEVGTGEKGPMWSFAIDYTTAEVAAMLADEDEADQYIVIWNRTGASSNGNVPGWYQSSDDQYLSLGTFGEKIDPVAAADYTAVDAALETVPEDLSGYTEESAAAVTAAVEAVDRELLAIDQWKVDLAAKAIETAVAGLEEASVPVEGALVAYNDEKMFKVVSAYVETTDGETDLVFALNGEGYKYVIPDADYYEGLEKVADKANWIEGTKTAVEMNYFDVAASKATTGTADKLQFRIPVTELLANTDEEGFAEIPIVALSNSKVEAAETAAGEDGTPDYSDAVTARMFTVNVVQGTLVAGNWHKSDMNVTVSADNDELSANIDPEGRMSIWGYPTANEYTVQLEVAFANDMIDKAFVGTAERAAEVDAEPAQGGTDDFDGEIVTELVDGKVLLPLINSRDHNYHNFDPETGEATIALHVAEDASYLEAGEWIEATVKFSQKDGTIELSTDAELNEAKAYELPDLDVYSINEDGTTKSFGMLKIADGKDEFTPFMFKIGDGYEKVTFAMASARYDAFAFALNEDVDPEAKTLPEDARIIYGAPYGMTDENGNIVEVAGYTFTFDLTADEAKTLIEDEGALPFVVKYIDGYSETHDGDWYIPTSGSQYYFSLGTPVEVVPDDSIDTREYAGAAFEAGFTDLNDTAWYMSEGFEDEDGYPTCTYLDYAIGRGLMSGSGDKFNPDGTVSKAMVATILYRASVEDSSDTVDADKYATAGDNGLTDVESGKYYTAAVNWCVENNIITGNNGKFSPTANVTRQQLATMIARWIDAMGVSVEAADLSAYPDADSVAGYAKDAVAKCIGAEIMSGSNGKINPTGNAKRSQMAKIIAIADYLVQTQ